MSVSKKNTVVHISFSSYNVCIRPEAGFCCVQYQVCSDPGSFTIAAGATEIADPLVFKAAQDTSCTSDYIDIAGKLESLVFYSVGTLKNQRLPKLSLKWLALEHHHPILKFKTLLHI